MRFSLPLIASAFVLFCSALLYSVCIAVYRLVLFVVVFWSCVADWSLGSPGWIRLLDMNMDIDMDMDMEPLCPLRVILTLCYSILFYSILFCSVLSIRCEMVHTYNGGSLFSWRFG